MEETMVEVTLNAELVQVQDLRRSFEKAVHEFVKFKPETAYSEFLLESLLKKFGKLSYQNHLLLEKIISKEIAGNSLAEYKSFLSDEYISPLHAMMKSESLRIEEFRRARQIIKEIDLISAQLK